jgi:hypothetical protein
MFISVLITTVLTVYVWRAMMDRLQPAMAQEGGNFQCPFGGGTVAKTEANK